MWSLIPRTTPALAGARTCWCPCHADGEANVAPINGLVTPGVPREDAIGAATACPRCLRYHTPALSGTPPELGYRATPKAPAPARGAWQQDATGTTYHFGGGDGDE